MGDDLVNKKMGILGLLGYCYLCSVFTFHNGIFQNDDWYWWRLSYGGQLIQIIELVIEQTGALLQKGRAAAALYEKISWGS